MNNIEKNPEEIIEEFFNSMQRYVQNLIVKKKNLIGGLYDFFHEAWQIPKEYKGNSSQMGFIPEYLVFETVQQYVAKKKKLTFLPIIRTKTSDGNVETNYFVDDPDNPMHLLCQGLKVHDTRLAELGLQEINKAYDMTYLIKKDAY